MIIRRFTKHVTDQNWFAVGLDVIVVITGIFLGMQVTDWNEQRKERAFRAIQLGSLVDDLKLMRASLAEDMENITVLKNGAKSSLKSLEKCQLDPAAADLIQSSFDAYQTAPAPTIYRGAFDEMLATGTFAQLRDKKLKSSITSLYSGLESFNAVVAFMRRDLSAAGQIMWGKIDFSFEDSTGRGVASFNLLEFCDDRLMRNAIWELADTRADWSRYAGRVIAEIDALLAVLEEAS